MFKLVSRSRSLIEGKGSGRRAATKAPVTHVPDEPLHGGPATVSDEDLHIPSYNDYETHVDVSRNKNHHASRALPDIPITFKAKMADRPSTSGGPGSRKTAKTDFSQFDKRVSRDDFYLGSRARGETLPGSFVPFRGLPPTPDASPRSAPTQRFRSATTTAAKEPMGHSTIDLHDGGIGMALGSPSHPPVFKDTWGSQNAAPPVKERPPIASPPASRSSSVDTFEVDEPVSSKKQPQGRWKLFGLFGKKKSNPSISVAQMSMSISDPNGLHGTNRPEAIAAAAAAAEAASRAATSQVSLPTDVTSPTRSNTVKSLKQQHKPIVLRSQTMPTGQRADEDEQRGGRGGMRVRDDGRLERIPMVQRSMTESRPATKPMLNVEIPDANMERYSVMFNGVLNNSNPSLASRRQANVQKLKTGEGVANGTVDPRKPVLARRPSSPQLSSKLALFPTSRQTQAQNQNLLPTKLSPRPRSNTSPALLPSPSRATFDRKTPSPQRPSPKRPSPKRLQSVKEASGLQTTSRPSPHPEAPGIAVTTDSYVTERESSPPSRQRKFSNDQSNLILDDSPSDDDPESVSSSVPAWKPPNYQPPEPKWQMISPAQKTPPTASSSASSQRKRSPSLASSSHTHITQPSEERDDIGLHSDGRAMTPVEISIARQISMSRQQRKLLLQPLRTGGPIIPPPTIPLPSVCESPSNIRKQSVTGHAHAASPGPSSASRKPSSSASSPARIVETKMSTPTLVHPPNLLNPNDMVMQAQYRRSERIVLEDA
ncbi:hypothetical protein F4808DRAFT_168331 [Astrocystis sublimbata]|nr:hypothetical protein F4808DRAFT_168331 [Astrocystis sublimbata]